MTGYSKHEEKSGSSLPLISTLREVLDPALNPWLVGGAVRDQLAVKVCHDLDIILPDNAKKAARQIADALNGDFYALDDERGMYRILIPGSDQADMIDISRFQAESLEADLAMRDFTINAIAVRLHNPTECIDPLNGRQDLKDKILRPCRSDSLRMDPVRAIRAARLSLGFNLKMVEGLPSRIRETAPFLSDVSAERKRDEIFKLLEEPRPATAIRLLDKVGILCELLPDVPRLKGVTQSSPHTLDVWEHTLAVVSRLSDLLDLFLNPDMVLGDGGNLTLGLAAGKLGRFRPGLQNHFVERYNPFRSRRGLCLLGALLHDIAKPMTRAVGSDERVHFYNHEVKGAKRAMEIARQMALSESEAAALSSMVTNHLRPRYLSAEHPLPTRRNVYRYFRSAGLSGVETCLLALADFLALTNLPPDQEEWTRELERASVYLEGWFEKHDAWVKPVRLLSGADIMRIFKLPPSRMIGKILSRLQEAQASGEVNSREEALELAKVVIADQRCEDKNDRLDQP
ncbi:MAG: HD domain-containing protein [Leptolinea sp.]|nr:HD domain-containing protein [Leptolinea sp.]